MNFHQFWGFWLMVYLSGFFLALLFRLFIDLFFENDEEKRLKINFKRD